MDRRTLLAFALIFLILIGSQFLMEKLYGDREAAAGGGTATETIATGSDQSTAPEDPTAAGTADRSGAVGRDPVVADDRGETQVRTAGDATSGAYEDEGAILTAGQALAAIGQDRAAVDIIVATPLYRAVVSTHGGRITSFKLAEHALYTGQPVELIPQGDEFATDGADALIFDGGMLALGALRFTYDGAGQLELGPDSPPQTVTLNLTTAGGVVVRKTLVFHPDRYDIDLELEVAAAADRGRFERTLQTVGDPQRALFGWSQGIASTERNQRTESAAFRSFAQVGDALYVKKRGGLAKSEEKVAGVYTGSVVFAGLQNKYFMATGMVQVPGEEPVEGRVVLGGDKARNQQTWLIDVPLKRQLSGGDPYARARVRLFVGPQERDLLLGYGIGLEKSIDLGFKLFRPMAEAVLWVMGVMGRFIPNYGVVIILFSVLTKLLFYPLTRKSTESMKRMQELQPKIKALQEKYKDNRDKQSKAMMELYKTEKINPMAGCLPLLVQMPVFIALYQGLMHTIALRNTPFTLWINDLSQPDAMFQLPFSLPMLGSDFNLLPILMAGLMVIQTKLTPSGAAGGQMAAMNTVMPVVMLFIFYQMPSGLVLYWLVNTIMTIYQTWRIHKTAPATGGELAT
jgi:YidC/Oxa1 family membrane protein insertase